MTDVTAGAHPGAGVAIGPAPAFGYIATHLAATSGR